MDLCAARLDQLFAIDQRVFTMQFQQLAGFADELVGLHFVEAFPDTRVRMRLSDRKVDILADGLDIAFFIGTPSDSNMKLRKIADCARVLCAAPRYLDERGVPRSVADLGQHNCLGYSLASLAAGKVWPFGRNAEVRIAVNGDLVANNGEALVAAAVGGQGVIYQPPVVARPTPVPFPGQFVADPR